jgi:hypothetical protein
VVKIVRIDSNEPPHEEVKGSRKQLRVHPLRTWHYYLAVMIAIALLLSIVTGTGAILYKKSEEIVQRYVDRLYGLDEE